MANPIVIPTHIIMATGDDVAYTIPADVYWVRFRGENPTGVVLLRTVEDDATAIRTIDDTNTVEFTHTDLPGQVFYFRGTTNDFVEVEYATGQSGL